MNPARPYIQKALWKIPFRRAFTSQKNYDRSYLENWVGTGNKSSNNPRVPNDISSSINAGVNKATVNSPMQQSLQVMGSSYLLPTLRLPRNASASSLSSDLSSFLDGTTTSTGNTNNHAMKSMLKPKPASGNVTWRVPIILDLGAFQHDGSPHYVPPPVGFLRSIISVFDEWGIAVMGLTNVQTVENASDEIADMSLPVLGRVGSGRTLGKKSNNGSGENSVGVEELVQLVLKKMDTSASTDETIEASSAFDDDDVQLTVDAEGSGQEEEYETSSVPELSCDDILDMTFRQLQIECKSLGLVAIGATEILQTRLLEYYGHDDALNEHEDTETIDEEIMFAPASSTVPAKIYHGSVRSGQQVSTDEPNQSLIIMGNVNSGGEVMADADIFIFGTLRGRALAGLTESDIAHTTANDDFKPNESKIICSHFDAELICIGETFTTVDSIESVGLKEGSAAMITRDVNGSLNFNGF